MWVDSNWAQRVPGGEERVGGGDCVVEEKIWVWPMLQVDHYLQPR